MERGVNSTPLYRRREVTARLGLKKFDNLEHFVSLEM
jgi:hypothetical protein